MSLRLIRTISPAAGTLPADVDWAGTLAAPGFAAWAKQHSTTKAMFVFKGFDTGGTVEIGLAGMTFGFAVVADMPMGTVPASTKLVELAPSLGFPGPSMGLEVDLPSFGLNLYPRITALGAGVPGTLDKLEIWAGPYQ